MRFNSRPNQRRDGVGALGAIAPGLTVLVWWGTGQGPQEAHPGGEELSQARPLLSL